MIMATDEGNHLALATLLSIVHALKASLSTLILTISATKIYKKKSQITWALY